MEKLWFGDPLQHWKLEYRTGGVVKITVPVYLQKNLQHGAKVVHFRYLEDTLGAQMCSNVVLEASVWGSKILCFFYYPLGIEIDPKKPLKIEWFFLTFDVFLGTCYQDGSKGPPGTPEAPSEDYLGTHSHPTGGHLGGHWGATGGQSASPAQKHIKS